MPILTSYRQLKPKKAKNAASVLVGWDVGEYGRPRDSAGPFPPTLAALNLDDASYATLTNIIDKTLHIHSASDVSVRVCACLLVEVCCLSSDVSRSVSLSLDASTFYCRAVCVF